MCVGIPMKLIAIAGTIGTVEEAGVSREIGLDLLEAPRIGDYVLVHAGYAIEQLDPAEAQITLDLLRRVHILEDDAEEGDGESDEDALEQPAPKEPGALSIPEDHAGRS